MSNSPVCVCVMAAVYVMVIRDELLVSVIVSFGKLLFCILRALEYATDLCRDHRSSKEVS